MSGYAYRLSGITHAYDGQPVLDIPSLELEAGRIIGVMGPNGSGKTTLLKILALVMAPSGGRLELFGQRVDFGSLTQRRRVSLLTQEAFLLSRSVFENVAYGPRLRGLKEGLKDRVEEALGLVGLDYGEFAHRPVRALSGGQAKRVALAARLAIRPEVLLLDEPLASVDAASAQLIKRAVRMAAYAWGATLLIVSHDQGWLEAVAERLVFLNQGRVGDWPGPVLVSGPWEAQGGFLCRELDDGQVLGVKREWVNTRGLLEIFSVRLEKAESMAGPGRLKGLVRAMSREPVSGGVSVEVNAGGLVLKTVVTQGQAAGLTPGQVVRVILNP